MAVARELGRGEQSTLDIRAVVRPGHRTLILSGDLDLGSADRLEPLVMRICAEGTRYLGLDLAGLSFMDCSGLEAILAAQRICRDHRTRFMVSQPRGSVRRLFEITGTIDVLPFGHLVELGDPGTASV
jgi:anti-anti-sigma factor